MDDHECGDDDGDNQDGECEAAEKSVSGEWEGADLHVTLLDEGPVGRRDFPMAGAWSPLVAALPRDGRGAVVRSGMARGRLGERCSQRPGVVPRRIRRMGEPEGAPCAPGRLRAGEGADSVA